MYLEHFGLRKLPFSITPDTEAFFEGCNRGAALNALCYAVSQGEGITKVVGEVGTGKTMLCRMLPVELKDTVDWVYLAHPNLSPEHTLYNIALELGLPIKKDDDKLVVMWLLQEALLEKHTEGRQVVVMVEEAQNMPLESLEEIRLLSNLETSEHKLLQIILFGQPELDEKLANNSIRQLRERITYSLYLDPLEFKDIQKYIDFRLRSAGYTGPELFNEQLAKEIARYSKGLVRRVNILCDKALLAAFTNERHDILISDIRNAASDSQYTEKKHWWQIWAAACVLCCSLNSPIKSLNVSLSDQSLQLTEINNEAV